MCAFSDASGARLPCVRRGGGTYALFAGLKTSIGITAVPAADIFLEPQTAATAPPSGMDSSHGLRQGGSAEGDFNPDAVVASNWLQWIEVSLKNSQFKNFDEKKADDK